MTRRRLVSICYLLAALAIPAAALAQSPQRASDESAEPPEDADVVSEASDEAGSDSSVDDTASQDSGDEPGLSFDLNYRIWGDTVTQPDFATISSPRTALYQTLRLEVSDQLTDNLAFGFEADLASGRIAGDAFESVPEGVPTGTRPRGQFYDWPKNIVDVRQLYAEYMTPVGQLQLGLQSSDWGLGILANSGSYELEPLFDQHYGGDRVFRGVFATAPLQAFSEGQFARHFFVALGGDVVYRDENADFREGDRAYQGVLAALYDREESQAGTYMVYRNQTDRDGDYLRVFAFDIFGENEWSLGAQEDWTIGAAAEAALLLGETNRALSTNTAEPLDVVGLGAAAELHTRWEPAKVAVHLNGGYASGDANSDDETLYRFRFDPNYNVGLVMFDHYIPAATLESYRRITDPSNADVPPKGAEALVNDGGIENAYYLNPQLRFGDEEGDGLLTGFGILWAIAEQPVADPYSSFEAGGNPIGLLGAEPASRQIGWEADASMRYRITPVDELTLEAKGEYGIFFPGDAFADASGKKDGPQSLGRLRLAVYW